MDYTIIRHLIGKNMRYWRKRAGFSQVAVGNHLGISFQQVQKYEVGIDAITCEKLLRLTLLFGCTLTDFIFDREAYGR